MDLANGGLSDHVTKPWEPSSRIVTLIKAQFSALDMATERGTSDETEATHLRACAQPADIDKVRSCGLDCDGMRYAFQ